MLAVSAREKARECLKEVFGYPDFRMMQEQCILSVLEKKDTVLVMPTGGGKSLCYQIPALLFDGLTVVISPLISLMQDQVSQLQDLGIEAACLNSSLAWQDYRMVMDRVRCGRIKILFMAPETAFKEDVADLLSGVTVDCLTVDEAHCISEWGHDFRPEYRRLDRLRESFPSAVTLAMTATATERVRRDISVNLGIGGAQVLVASFNRTNLFYEVIPKTQPQVQLVDFLERFRHQSGIIYCFSRQRVEEVSAHLTRSGFPALAYHAGLPDGVRRRNQEAFIRDDVPVMVATIAFGMGINKPNVRFVVHYDLPRNIESYYQETGRAGRDGLPSHCLLLFSYGDIQKIKYLIDQKGNPSEQQIARQHLNTVVHYAEAEVCRRVPLITYFGEKYEQETCGLCDNCVNPKVASFDLTLPAQKLMACMLRTGQRFGATHVIDVLRGGQTQKVRQYDHQDLDVYGIGREYTAPQWQFILRQLIQQGWIRRTDDQYAVIKLTPRAAEVLKKQRKVMGHAPPEKPVKKKTSPAPKTGPDRPVDQSLFEQLRIKRKEIADRKNVPPYIVFSDKSLVEMSRLRPSNEEQFAEIYGVGQKKLKEYAQEFLEVIRDHRG